MYSRSQLDDLFGLDIIYDESFAFGHAVGGAIPPDLILEAARIFRGSRVTVSTSLTLRMGNLVQRSNAIYDFYMANRANLPPR